MKIHIIISLTALLCMYCAEWAKSHPVEDSHVTVAIKKGDTTVEIDLDEASEEKSLGSSPDTAADSCSQIAEMESCSKSGYYWVKVPEGPVGVYCEMKPPFQRNGGWMRVAAINMTQKDSQCPHGLELLIIPRRMCRRPLATSGCSSVIFSTRGIRYSKVCGKVIGYQYDSPDAFAPYINNPSLTIDDRYVDGISITHGRYPRKHIWTLAAALDEVPFNPYFVCSCTNTTVSASWTVPPFVGSDYYCETALRTSFTSQRYMYYLDDPLWDGKGCGPQSICCEGEGKPWFCKDLDEVTNDDIEMRFCTNQPRSDEDFPVEIIELYIQ